MGDMTKGITVYAKWNNANVIKVSQYKGLHVKDLLRFASSKVNIDRYLHDYE